MADKPSTEISPYRLRIGVVLLFLWWIPFWALAPAICEVFGVSSTSGQRRVTVGVLILQTIIGLVGIIITGKIIAGILRHTKYRKVPSTVLYMVWYGKVKPLQPEVDK